MNRRKWYAFRDYPGSSGHSLEVPLRPEEAALTRLIQLSYSTAITRHRNLHWTEAISWFTWIIALITFAIWCLTAYQVALAAGAHTLHDVLANAFSNSQNADVLIDAHSLTRRWLLALLTIAATGLFAIISVHFIGG